MIKFDILTLFPEMFTGILGSSILKREIEKDDVDPKALQGSELPIKSHNRTPGSIILVPMQAGNLCASFIISDIKKELFK